MQYLRARYYKPETANFLTEDSYLGDILKPLTLNRYNYCAENPVNYKDPSGNTLMDIELQAWEKVKSKIGEVAEKVADKVSEVANKLLETKTFMEEAAEWVVDDMPRELAEKYDFMEKPVSAYYDVVNGMRTAYAERSIYDNGGIKIAGDWLSDFFSYDLRRANSNAADNYAYYSKLAQENTKAGCKSADSKNWFDAGRGVGYAVHDIMLMLGLKGLYDLSASLAA